DCVMKIPLVKFTVNLSISVSMGFVPFELNFRYMPTFVTMPPGVQHFIQEVIKNLSQAHNAITTSCVTQVHHENQ
ncbi:hypothetical protein PAXRUDRAFT_37112, partial [Paxillus rubicundulus Ve08.2h10]